MADSEGFSVDYYNLANIGRFYSDRYARQAVMKRELVFPDDFDALAQEAEDLFSGVEYAMMNLDFSAFISALRLDPATKSCRWGTVHEIFISARPDQLDIASALDYEYHRCPGCVVNLSYPVEELEPDFAGQVLNAVRDRIAGNAKVLMGIAGVPKGAAVGVNLWLLVPGDRPSQNLSILSEEETFDEMLDLFRR